MQPQRTTFRVEKPFPRDSGTNQAVISLDTLEDLGWAVGSAVEIRGPENAVATVASSRTEETADHNVRLDIFTRKNAGVSIGDTVEVGPVQTENADSLVISIPREAPAPEIGVSEIHHRLRGMPATKDQFVPVRLNQDPRQSIGLQVRQTRPEGVVVVSENTEIQLKRIDEPHS